MNEPVVERVTIHLLEREFQLACPPGERDGLIAAAQQFDQRMRELRQSARQLRFDRLVVLAAIGLSHDLLEATQRRQQERQDVAAHLGLLRQRLEAALEHVPAPL